MAKNKIDVVVNLTTQYRKQDLEPIKKTLNELQSIKLDLAPTEQKQRLKDQQQQLKDLRETLESVLDVNSPEFINQNSLDGFKKVDKLIKQLHQKIIDITTEAKKGIQLEFDSTKLNDELSKSQAKLKELTGSAPSPIVKIATGKPLSMADTSSAKMMELEAGTGLDVEAIGRSFRRSIVNAEPLINKVNELSASFGVTTNEAEQLAIIVEKITKLDPNMESRTSDELMADAQNILQFYKAIQNPNFDLENFTALKEANKEVIDAIAAQTAEVEKNKAAIVENEAAKQEQIDNLDKEAVARFKLLQTQKTDDAAKQQKELLEKKAEEEESRNSAAMDSLIKKYLSFTAVLATVQKLLKTAFDALSKLDKAFTEMAVVTSYSTKQIWGFYDSFKGIAEITGFTTAEIAAVTAEYLKQGETLQDSLKLTEAAAKAAQVAGISTADSVRYLTAAVRGYRLAADDAMAVSDKFAAVAAATATDYDGLATAMTKVAAQAYANGVEIDNLMGLLSTAMDVTQEAPENIGTAFKTIFARMTQISDYGRAIEDGVDLNKVENALNLVNVKLRDTEGNMRKLDDVLMEVGAGWKDLNSTQKAYITNTLAGTRQQTRLLAVFENYDKLLENIETSQQAAGATNAQQAKYMEGLAASVNKVTVSWENLITSITDTAIFKGSLQFLSGIIDGLSKALEGPSGLVLKFTALVLAIQSLSTAGVQAYNMLDAYRKKFGTGERFLTGAIRALDTLSVTLLAKVTPGAKIAGKAVTWLSTTLSALQAALPWLIAISAGLIVVNTLINTFGRDAQIKKLNNDLSKTNGLVYELGNKQSSMKKLIEEFDSLNNKTVKTNEDLERMKNILQALDDLDVDNKYEFSNEDGTMNVSEVNRAEKDIEEERAKLFKEARETEVKLANQYSSQRKGIEEDLHKVTNAYIWKAVDENEEAYEAIAKQDKQAINNKVAEMLKATKIEEREIGSESDKDDITMVNVRTAAFSQEEIEAETKFLVESMNRIRSLIDETTTLASASDIITKMFNPEQIEKLKAVMPELANILKFDDLDMTYAKFTKLSTSFDFIIGKTGELKDSLEKGLIKSLSEGFPSSIQYVTSNAEKMGLSLNETLEIVSELNNTLNDVSFESITSGMTNLDGLSEKINNISFDSLDASNLENVMALMTEFPQHAEAMIKGIEETGEIDQITKDAMMQSGKALLLAEMDQKIQKLETDREVLKAQLASAIITADDLSDLNSEMSQNAEYYSDKTAEELVNNHEKYFRYKKDADAKEVAAANAKYRAIVEAATTGMGSMPDVGLPIKPVFSPSIEIRDKVSAYVKDLKTQINNKTNEIDVMKLGRNAVANKNYDTPATKKAKEEKGSKSSGKSNAAAKEAEVYLGKLNQVYLMEQKIKAAELFMDKNNAALEFARSVEAIGDAAGAVVDGYVPSGRVLEEQYHIYRVMNTELAENNKLLEEQKAELLTGLSPAQKAAFKILDGKLVPITEEYSKLSAEEMEALDNTAEAYNAKTDAVNDNTQAITENATAMNNIIKEMQDTVIEFHEAMINAITIEEQRYLDSFKKIIDANKKYIAERKKLYEDSFKEEDNTKKAEDIEQERLTISEQIAALEAAHDLKSIRKKEELKKKLQDLDVQFNELSLQYNRDAFLQKLDEQMEYQDTLYTKEEEAFNERINDAQYMEDRILGITRAAQAQALVDKGLQDMTMKELIEAGYITQEQATAAGLDKVKGKVSEWSTAEQAALTTHFSENETAFETAWGEKTAPGAPGAAGIVAQSVENIAKYLSENTSVGVQTTAMLASSTAAWKALTSAANTYTNGNYKMAKAPDYSATIKHLEATTKAYRDLATAAGVTIPAPKPVTTTASGGTTTPAKTPTPPATVTETTKTVTWSQFGTVTNGIVKYVSSDGRSGWDQAGRTGAPRYSSYDEALRALQPTTSGSSGGGGASRFQNSVSRLATGGTTTRTGFHWLDGKPGAPERVLSPQQNKAFTALIEDLAVESKYRIEASAKASFDDSSKAELRAISQTMAAVGKDIVKTDIQSTAQLAQEIRQLQLTQKDQAKQIDVLKKYGITTNKY